MPTIWRYLVSDRPLCEVILATQRSWGGYGEAKSLCLRSGGAKYELEALGEFSGKLTVLNVQKDLKAEDGWVWGPVLVFRRLWEELGLARLWEWLHEETQVEFDLPEAVFAMVLNRLMDPASRKSLVEEWLPTIWEPGFAGLKLHHRTRRWEGQASIRSSIRWPRGFGMVPLGGAGVRSFCWRPRDPVSSERRKEPLRPLLSWAQLRQAFD